MKSRHMIMIIAGILMPMLLAAQSPVFSVRVGPIMQSSQIGLDMGSIQPYIGVDYLSMGFDATMKTMFYIEGQDSTDMILVEQSKENINGTVSMWMPHIGVRLYLNSNVTKPYIFAGLFKAFPSVNVKGDIEYEEYDETGAKQFSYNEKMDLLDKETKDAIEDLLAVWGLNFGFGAEYKFNEHLSVGGEFGFKLAKTSMSLTEEDSDYDDILFKQNQFMLSSGVTKTDVSANLSFSYAAICLNFHL